jgi:transposase, IS5 family
VDFERFRGWLVEGLGYGDGSKGGRPPFDAVSMFKALILQAQHNLSDARMPFMIRARLSWMRVLGFDLGAPTPDENTIRHFRNRLTETGTLKRVMKAFDWRLRKKGYIRDGRPDRRRLAGPCAEAAQLRKTRRRRSRAASRRRRSGRTSRTRAAQKDVSARWTLKIGGKPRHRPDGTPVPMIAVPVFGDKSHIGIDRRFGFIREGAVTSASAPDGRQLRHLVSRENTGSEVWSDSAYRSRKNEKWLTEVMLTSRIHRRKPAGRPMPLATARANAKKSAVRARIEHVFAHQKTRFGLFIRTIGIARAEAKLTLANSPTPWTG